MNRLPLPAAAIAPKQAPTLDALFRARCQATPEAIAYREFDSASQSWHETRWSDASHQVGRWRAALAQEQLQPGDRVAVMLSNGRPWVYFEQAALSLGLVVVPLYANDRPESISFILQDAGIRVLLCNGDTQLKPLQAIHSQLDGLNRIITLEPTEVPSHRTRNVHDWLTEARQEAPEHPPAPDDLATLVYTSGTTGRPKGVMLSHRNILANAYSGLQSISVYPNDVFLSFLPLSHMLERTVGHYIPMIAGATVAYARSVQQLADDLQIIRPTILISVPRIYERIYNRLIGQIEEKGGLTAKLFHLAVNTGWQRHRRRIGQANWSAAELGWPALNALVARKVMARLGGRLRFAICGGAPLAPAIARTFVGLGLPLVQGYGLTETSPVISVNRLDDNRPDGVGPPLPGIEVRVGAQDELFTRSASVMQGYWHNPQATADILDADGWLHTGDQAVIDDGHIRITGRLKEILVLSNGEKVPPADMEMAISLDPLFEQCMVIGDNRPFLSAIAVLNPEHWEKLAASLELSTDTPTQAKATEASLARIARQLAAFPGYAQVRRVHLTLKPWTIDNGLLTPTLKLRRKHIIDQYQDVIEGFYRGH